MTDRPTLRVLCAAAFGAMFVWIAEAFHLI